MMDDYEDEDMGMEEEEDTSPEAVLVEAGFTEDQADAIVAAVRLCKSSSGEAPEEGKKKAGSGALALLLGGPEGKK